MTRFALSLSLSLISCAMVAQLEPVPERVAATNVAQSNCVAQGISCPAAIDGATSSTCTNPEFFTEMENWYSFAGIAGESVTVDLTSSAAEVQFSLWKQGSWSSTATFGGGCTAEPCTHRFATRTLPVSGTWIIAVHTYVILGTTILDTPASFTLGVTGCSGVPSGQPNFTAYRVLHTDTCPGQPELCSSDWSDKVVVSTSTGTHSDALSLLPSDPLFVDWAIVNNGTGAAAVTVQTALYVDGVLKQTWHTDPPWNANTYSAVQDYAIGSLAAGTHTIRLTADSTNAVAESNEGDNAYTKTVTVGAVGGSCTVSDISLCLSAARFKVSVAWQTGPVGGTPTAFGDGTAVSLTSDTGYFWFFDSANVEVIVKVLDARGVNNHFWVFAAGLTNVRATVTVTDTVTGGVRTYVNPQGTAFQPVQDTNAFSP